MRPKIKLIVKRQLDLRLTIAHKKLDQGSDGNFFRSSLAFPVAVNHLSLSGFSASLIPITKYTPVVARLVTWNRTSAPHGRRFPFEPSRRHLYFRRLQEPGEPANTTTTYPRLSTSSLLSYDNSLSHRHKLPPTLNFISSTWLQEPQQAPGQETRDLRNSNLSCLVRPRYCLLKVKV